MFETLLVSGRGRRSPSPGTCAGCSDSAALLGLAEPDVDAARAGVAAVLADAGTRPPRPRPDPTDARLRITWTGGGHLLVTLTPLTPWPATATVVTAPWPQPTGPLAAAKSTSYAAFALARRYALTRGADEALLLTADGRLAEGATSSVVVGLDGRLVTPPLSTGILPGVTRALLLEAGLVEPAEVSGEQLAQADEVALLSSTRHVHPVGRLDGRGLDAPGPLVAAAAARYRDLRRADPDPA